MKRSASEIIRNLETRIARLESRSASTNFTKQMEEISKQMEMLESLYLAEVLTKSDYDKYVEELLLKVEVIEQAKERAKQQAQRENDPSQAKVGDILYSSWGYSMTIVDFYKVIKVSPSGKSVTLQRMQSDTVEGDAGYEGYVMPSKYEDSREQPIKNKRISPSRNGYSVKINRSEHAYKWDGKKKYFNRMD